MNALSEHCFCQSFGDGSVNVARLECNAWFTIVGDPVNVEAAIALFKWQKIRLEAAIDREWPRFQARQGSLGRMDGGQGEFRDKFLQGAVTQIQTALKERRRRNGHEVAFSGLSAVYKAAIDEYVKTFIYPPKVEPPPLPSPPTEEDYNLVELMGREIGEKLGQEPLQDS